MKNKLLVVLIALVLLLSLSGCSTTLGANAKEYWHQVSEKLEITRQTNEALDLIEQNK